MSDEVFSLTETSGSDLSALLYGSEGLISPFSQEIYIGRQTIVGMRFQGGAESLVNDLRPGDRISFLREPENEYDERAIMAVDGRGRKLGYIPRRENLVMSALMDHGKAFYGLIPDVPQEEYAYSRKYPKQMLESGVEIPVTITVDLYMREFAVPEDMTVIPRSGSDGSYAVLTLWLSEDEPGRIRRLCAIKVINGEEKGMLDKRISMTDQKEESPDAVSMHNDHRAEEESALKEFDKFIGFLPIVSHGINGELRKALEEAYGVLLGKTLSNLFIDTKEMAENHLPEEANYGLYSLCARLGIRVKGVSHAERSCRRTWELYRRMDKSKLDKKSGKNSNKMMPFPDTDDKSGLLDKSIDVYPMSDRVRTVLRLNNTLTLRELSRCSEAEVKHFKCIDHDCQIEMQDMLENIGVSFRPGRKRRLLYGYPDKMQLIKRQKKDFWEHHLLFMGISVYYEWLLDARRQKAMYCWDEDGPMTASDLQQLKDLVIVKNDEIVSILKEINSLVNERMIEAVGAPGEPGDAVKIMKMVEDLAGSFKKIMIWRYEFKHINVPEYYRDVVEAVVGWGEDVLKEYDRLYLQCKEGISQIEACLDGTMDTADLSVGVKIKLGFESGAVINMLKNLSAIEMLRNIKITVKEEDGPKTSRGGKTYPESIYKVGTDIPAGKYKLFVDEGESTGYYSVCKDPNCDVIVENGVINKQAYIDIHSGQFLKLSRCTAVPIDEADMFDELIYTPGEYLVGKEIPAGEYKLQADDGEKGYYAIVTFTEMGSRKIDSNGIFKKAAYVQVREGQILVLKHCTLKRK